MKFCKNKKIKIKWQSERDEEEAAAAAATANNGDTLSYWGFEKLIETKKEILNKLFKKKNEK